MIGQDVLYFGDTLRGRIDQKLLDFALSYVYHNEVPLALETIFDYMIEGNICIDRNEYNAALDLAKKWGVTDYPAVSHLKSLVI